MWVAARGHPGRSMSDAPVERRCFPGSLSFQGCCGQAARAPFVLVNTLSTAWAAFRNQNFAVVFVRRMGIFVL